MFDDQDKEWLLLELGKVHFDLSQRIQRIETGLGQVDTRLEQVETRLEQVETRLEQKIERVETNLLTEFHKWASPAEARARTHAAAIRTIDLEMEARSDRVTKLE